MKTLDAAARTLLLGRLRLGEAAGDELFDPWILCQHAADVIDQLVADLGSERARSMGIARSGCARCVDMPDAHVPALRCVRCGTGYWFEGDHHD